MIQSKMNELAWRQHFPIISLWAFFGRSRTANSIVSGPIWPKFELVRDSMHVLVTCKYKKDLIKIGQLASEIFKFESVDDGQTTDRWCYISSLCEPSALVS